MKKVSIILKEVGVLGIAIGIMLTFFVGCSKSDYESNFIEEVDFQDYNLELDKVNIEVEGIEGEYTFLFMTDNQANFDDRIDLGWFGYSENRCYKDSNGISSADNLINWIRYANDSQVDALLMGGDIIDFCSEKNTSALQETLVQLKVPYLYTYGNHDSYIPWEDKFDDDNQLFLQFFKERNCEFQVMDIGELNIVSIRNYQVNGFAQVSQEVLDGFKDVMKEGKLIVLICHVPIYTEMTESLKNQALEHQGDLVVKYDAGEFGTVNKSVLMGEGCGYELTDETKEFLDLVTSPENSVIMVLSGHLHERWQGKISGNVYHYVGDGAFTNKGALIHIAGTNN